MARVTFRVMERVRLRVRITLTALKLVCSLWVRVVDSLKDSAPIYR